MMIEIDLSQRAIDKILALGKLTGRDPKEVSKIISGIVESSLDNLGSVVEQALLGGTQPTYRKEEPEKDLSHMDKKYVPREYNQDTTGISDGLGDDDVDAEEIPGETDPEALIPNAGAVTDDDLDNELKVSDPGTEGVAEATFGEDIEENQVQPEAEKVFGDLLGTPVPNESYYGDPVPEDDPHQRKRATRGRKSKGKVVPLTHEPTL